MELIEKYSDLVIAPIEKEVKKLRAKVYGKRFSLTRNTDKECLEKLEHILFEYYKKYEVFITNEFKFNERIEREITKNT